VISAPPPKPKPAEVLAGFLGKSPAPSNSEVIIEINRLVAEYKLDAKDCALLVFDALLSDLATLKDKIKPYKDILVKVRIPGSFFLHVTLGILTSVHSVSVPMP
jgi:hypothetical protein